MVRAILLLYHKWFFWQSAPPDVFIRVYTNRSRLMRGFQLIGSYLLMAHKREELFWHSENNIIEYVIAYGLHVFGFKKSAATP